MVFAPVDPAIKEKVLSAYLAGHGRNQITREMHGLGIKVSHGSISNIINAYKRKHEQPSQPRPPPNDDNVGIPMNIGASSTPLNGITTTNSNVNSNTKYVKRNEGGPLLCFLSSDMDTIRNVNATTNPI